MASWEYAHHSYQLMMFATMLLWWDELETDREFVQEMRLQIEEMRRENVDIPVAIVATLAIYMFVIGLVWPITLTLYFREKR